ncbi:MAG: hypothetical protein FJX16_06480 [Alphaproteobacteria bacterium]|nr:hypothetical protein [Alphaproteobacteria bacterium]MBM3624955.1 hypothetical protein [Alphaproteobacteria bacterium]
MSTYFDWEVAQESARRQFRVSVLMVAAMAFAAFAIGFVLPVSSTHKATPTAANGVFAGRLITVSE